MRSARSCKGAFIAIGHIPNTDFVDGVLERDGDSYIVPAAGSQVKTQYGFFAAGDCVDPCIAKQLLQRVWVVRLPSRLSVGWRSSKRLLRCSLVVRPFSAILVARCITKYSTKSLLWISLIVEKNIPSML